MKSSCTYEPMSHASLFIFIQCTNAVKKYKITALDYRICVHNKLCKKEILLGTFAHMQNVCTNMTIFLHKLLCVYIS
jgi:hypothetical protein